MAVVDTETFSAFFSGGGGNIFPGLFLLIHSFVLHHTKSTGTNKLLQFPYPDFYESVRFNMRTTANVSLLYGIEYIKRNPPQ